MKRTLVVMLGVLSLAACAKQRQPLENVETVGTTTVRGANERLQRLWTPGECCCRCALNEPAVSALERLAVRSHG